MKTTKKPAAPTPAPPLGILEQVLANLEHIETQLHALHMAVDELTSVVHDIDDRQAS